MDRVNLVALAIPAFVVLIGVEVAVARWRGHKVHRIVDAVTALSCGIGNQVVGLLFKVVSLGIYTWIWSTWGLFDLGPGDPVAWFVGFLGVDLAYYWWHRASHEVNFMWAAHAVHHQSEDYNLAVALRQAWFTGLTSIPFYLPLAVLGVHPVVWLTHLSLSLLYQFWIHTQLIDRLGPLEAVLNTPSHHRVHHGINPRYLDRNHGGILIVWDRLFGTFETESEPVVYGTVRKTRSFNPVWANFDLWAHLVDEARQARTWADAARVFVARPDWRPPGLDPYPAAAEVHPDSFVKHEVDTPPAIVAYGVIQFAPLIPLVSALLAMHDPRAQAALGVLLVWTTLTIGGLFEDRPWAPPAELARLAAAPIAALICGVPLPGAALIATASLLSAAALRRARLPLPTPAPAAPPR